MAMYNYKCAECDLLYTVSKLMVESDRPEACPVCEYWGKRVFSPLPSHGLSDGPGTSTPNRPHRPIFDLVDTHNDSLYTYHKLQESGRLDKNPAMKRDIEIHLNDLKNTPREIIDYQKTGHDLER